MSAATNTPASKRPEDCATAWFAALEDGDVHRAAQATRELERLGVTVRFGKPGDRPPTAATPIRHT